MEDETQRNPDDLQFPDVDDWEVADRPDGCQLCGWRPAAEVSLRRQVAMLVSRRVESIDGRLCRRCGQSAYRSMTNRTLLTGWWGIIAFFANFLYVGRNVLAGRRLRQLSRPHAPPEDAEGFLPGPLDVGKPLSRRSGPWVVGILALLLVGGGVSAALDSPQRDEGGEIARGGTLDVAELREGDCFDDPDHIDDAGEAEVLDVRAVPCAQEHDNEVYKTGSLADGAEYPGDEAVFQQTSRHCVDAFEAFVGRPYADSALDFVVLTPTAESWGQGDRGYACAVYALSGPVEGSLRGAKR